MEKIIITIILVNTEITIIQTIIFEFENMMHYSEFLKKKKTEKKHSVHQFGDPFHPKPKS